MPLSEDKDFKLLCSTFIELEQEEEESIYFTYSKLNETYQE